MQPAMRLAGVGVEVEAVVDSNRADRSGVADAGAGAEAEGSGADVVDIDNIHTNIQKSDQQKISKDPHLHLYVVNHGK